MLRENCYAGRTVTHVMYVFFVNSICCFGRSNGDGKCCGRCRNYCQFKFKPKKHAKLAVTMQKELGDKCSTEDGQAWPHALTVCDVIGGIVK